jgi:hypothetical protein
MISFEIYKEVQEYIDSRISLHMLEERILPYMPDILSEPHSDNADLVSAIELIRVDYDNDLVDDAEARNYVDRVFRKYETSIVSATDQEFEIATGTSSKTSSRVEVNSSTAVIQLSAVPL